MSKISLQSRDLHGRAQTFLVPIYMYGDFMGLWELHMQLLVFIPDKLSCTLVTARLHTLNGAGSGKHVGTVLSCTADDGIPVSSTIGVNHCSLQIDRESRGHDDDDPASSY